LADNAKHNQNGRVDENGAIRHRNVEQCPVGGLAMLFYAHFHILHNEALDFSPDFDNTEYGEYGYRRWYDSHVFYGSDVKKEMSYDSKSHVSPSYLPLAEFWPQTTMLV
jgi:Centromere DNA-binding protein complex CBF3 subunit, domain 2